jgi:hypothetical protein
MATVNDMIKRMQSLNVKEVSYESVVETKETITEIQKDQMYHGLDGQGKKIRRYRSVKYARAKNEMNPLPGLGTPDLKLTGAFYRYFQTKVTPEAFSTSSTDEKNDALTAKYDPFGLDKESKSEYAGKLRPVLVKNVKEKLML